VFDVLFRLVPNLRDLVNKVVNFGIKQVQNGLIVDDPVLDLLDQWPDPFEIAILMCLITFAVLIAAAQCMFETIRRSTNHDRLVVLETQEFRGDLHQGLSLLRKGCLALLG
jgi:hypothetical protein